MTKELYSKIDGIKTKAVRLHKEEIIKKCTENSFIQQCNLLKEESSYYKGQDGEIPENIFKKTASQMSLLDEILERIERNDSIDHTYDDYFIEMLNKIGNFDEIDLWVIKSGEGQSPYCKPYCLNRDLSFILIVPEIPNYLTKELIGLLAHEVAHTHETICRYINSRNASKSKVGETLADLLSYIVTDSLFLYSADYLMNNIIGKENFTRIKPRHLSWIARIIVLKSLNDLIWSITGVREKHDGYFKTLLKDAPRINPIEEPIISKSIREGRDKIENFIEFKINEAILSNIDNLSKEELETSGRTIQLIHEIQNEEATT